MRRAPIDDWTGDWQPGVDTQRRDYASLADFADPDGNTWVIQEIGYRRPDSTDLDARRRPAARPGSSR